MIVPFSPPQLIQFVVTLSKVSINARPDLTVSKIGKGSRLLVHVQVQF